jgi:hypothetical protein
MTWWNDPTLWDWIIPATKSAVGALFGAAGGTALVQGIFVIHRDHRQGKAQAAYMAMRLAVTLESYAVACCDFVGKNDVAEYDHERGHPDWDTTLPTLVPYPDDAEGWRAIDHDLAEKCLILPLNANSGRS